MSYAIAYKAKDQAYTKLKVEKESLLKHQKELDDSLKLKNLEIEHLNKKLKAREDWSCKTLHATVASQQERMQKMVEAGRQLQVEKHNLQVQLQKHIDVNLAFLNQIEQLQKQVAELTKEKEYAK